MSNSPQTLPASSASGSSAKLNGGGNEQASNAGNVTKRYAFFFCFGGLLCACFEGG